MAAPRRWPGSRKHESVRFHGRRVTKVGPEVKHGLIPQRGPQQGKSRLSSHCRRGFHGWARSAIILIIVRIVRSTEKMASEDAARWRTRFYRVVFLSRARRAPCECRAARGTLTRSESDLHAGRKAVQRLVILVNALALRAGLDKTVSEARRKPL